MPAPPNIPDTVDAVRSALTDDLRSPTYRGHANPMAGHCYVASEALFHMLGGKPAGWTPQYIKHEGEPHWFLRHSGGHVLDPTADQFETPPDYAKGVGKGFLTAQPSRRAQEVIRRVQTAPLTKGSMQRLAPFNPQDPIARPLPYSESAMATWQRGAKDFTVDPENQPRNEVEHMTGNTRTRALHKLAAVTAVRRHPQTGEREFLLHRGMSPEEHAEAMRPESITHSHVVQGTLPAVGFINHKDPTSWSPRYTTASGFGKDYRGPTVSAWVPEQAITSIPKQYGKLDTNASDAYDEDDNYQPPKGANSFGWEHEVIVSPDHNSRLASPQEIESVAKPLTTLHGRINRAGRELLNTPEDTKSRLKHRSEFDKDEPDPTEVDKAFDIPFVPPELKDHAELAARHAINRYGPGVKQKAKVAAGVVAQAAKKVKAVVKKPFYKQETGFDRYLNEKLQDPEFAEQFKKAIADIQPGRLIAQNPRSKTALYDYTHVLSPKHIKAGYKLRVHDEGRSSRLSVQLLHRGPDSSPGYIDAVVHNGSLDPHYVDLEPEHQGKGLGTAMYEALYRHAQHKGIDRVQGGSHSSQASRVHAKLAAKHGLGYQAKPRLGNKQYPDEKAWKQAPAEPFDSKFAPYRYLIKTLDPAAKQAVACIVQRPDGAVLFGRRQDSGKWTAPGGHIEPGEQHSHAAIREVMEETGLTPKVVHHVGAGNGGVDGRVPVFVFRVVAHGTPTAAHDPDHEFAEFRWIDCYKDLPATIAQNLHHANDLVLRHLGIQPEVPLGKQEECPDCHDKDLKMAIIGEPVYACQACGKKWAVEGEKKLTKRGDDQAVAPAVHSGMPRKPKAKNPTEPDLVAIHNLSASNLLHAHQHGGLAAPSLAITHQDHPLTGFGDISLVAHHDLVDPAKTPVFDADVYSPRHPDTHFEINHKVLDKLKQEIEPHVKATRGYLGDLDQNLEREGVERVLQNYRVKYPMALAFLHQRGKAPAIPMQPVRIQHEWVDHPAMHDFFKRHGPGTHNIDIDSPEHKELSDAARIAIDDFVNKKIDDPEDREHMRGIYNKIAFGEMPADSESPELYRDAPAPLLSYNKLGGIGQSHQAIGKEQPDEQAMQATLEKEIAPHEAEFNRWARAKLQTALGRQYIPKHTASGSVRKIPYNLDNVLKEMTRKVRQGEDFNYGLGTARAGGAAKFKSLEHMQRHRHKIIPPEQFEKLKESMDDRFGKLADEIGQYHEYPGGFRVMDSLAQAVGDSYKRGHSIHRDLAQAGFQNVPPELASQIGQFAQDLVNMPTEYFEAKPQRVVGLHEFKGAAVPHDVDDEVVKALKQHGVDHIERYERSNPKARAEAIKRIATAQKLLMSEDQWTNGQNTDTNEPGA